MRASTDHLDYPDGERTPEAVERERRVRAALPGTFVEVAEGAGVTVNQALAVLGILVSRGEVVFVERGARYALVEK